MTYGSRNYLIFLIEKSLWCDR